MTLSLLLTVPMFVTAPWVLYELGAFGRVTFREHVARAGIRRFRHRGFVAMGCFQLSVAGAIIALSIQQKTVDPWSSAFPVGLMGIGFVVAGLWHPFEGLFQEEERP